MHKINKVDNKDSLVYKLFFKEAAVATGWDRFLEEGRGLTWDYVVETGLGNPTPEEEKAIMNGNFYGKAIDEQTVNSLKSGGRYAPESEFSLVIEAIDGRGENFFKTKEELINRAKKYPGYQKGENYWVTDNGQQLEANGATYDEIFATSLTPADYGRQAFQKGIKASPILDKEFMAVLKEKWGNNSSQALTEWAKGWHAENLKPDSNFPTPE